MRVNAARRRSRAARARRLGLPRAPVGSAARYGHRRLHRPLDRRPARARAADGRRRLGHQALPPRGGARARRGGRPAPQAGAAAASRPGPVVGRRARDPRRSVPGLRRRAAAPTSPGASSRCCSCSPSAEGKVLQREEIYQQVWGYAMAHGDRSVDVFVRKVRQKLERASPDWHYIHTHFGVGYRFDPEPRRGRTRTSRHARMTRPRSSPASRSTTKSSAAKSARRTRTWSRASPGPLPYCGRMRQQRSTLRAGALIAASALALHELRYLIGYGDGSGRAVADQGHSYLPAAGALVALLLALAGRAAGPLAGGAMRGAARGARADALLDRMAACERRAARGLLRPGAHGGLAHVRSPGRNRRARRAWRRRGRAAVDRLRLRCGARPARGPRRDRRRRLASPRRPAASSEPRPRAPGRRAGGRLGLPHRPQPRRPRPSGRCLTPPPPGAA